MKKLNKQQWADDAFSALETALIEFGQEYVNPTEDEKMELLALVADIAGERHTINDSDLLDQAHEYAMDHVDADLEDVDATAPNVGILFLVAYFDVLIYCKKMKLEEAEPVMLHLTNQYDLDIGL